MAHHPDSDADPDSATLGHRQPHGQPPSDRDRSYRRDLSPHLAAALRDARHRTGASLRQVAPVVGISPSYLSRLENGTRCPSREVAQELVRWLPLNEGVAEELLGVAVVRPSYE